MALESFADLVRAAREQPLRQRFLLVFVRAELPPGATTNEQARFQSRQGGALVPVMYADKGEHELDNFADLVAEARHAAQTLGQGVDSSWDLVIVGCLDGHAAEEPAPQEVDAALHDLLRTLRLGQSLAHLAVFDRQGQPVHFV